MRNIEFVHPEDAMRAKIASKLACIHCMYFYAPHCAYSFYPIKPCQYFQTFPTKATLSEVPDHR